MLQQLSVVLGILAGTIQLYGYWYYNTRSGQKINTGSWAIWAIGGVIDLVSYFAITQDWVVNLLPAACAAAAVGTFVYAVYRKRFAPFEKLDWAFLGADGVITILWFFTNAIVANLLYQASTVASFVPMVIGLLNRTSSEKPTAWFIWTVAYGILTVSVVLRMERWEELAYPVSHLITHLIVALVAIRVKGLCAKA